MSRAAFGERLEERIAASGLTIQELCRRIERDPSALYRLRAGGSTKEETVRRLDHHLNADGALIEAWAAAGTKPAAQASSGTVSRSQVAAVRFNALTRPQQEAEFRRYIDESPTPMTYAEPPSSFAGSTRQAALQDRWPFPIEALKEVARAYDAVAPPWSTRLSMDRARKAFRAVAKMQLQITQAVDAGVSQAEERSPEHDSEGHDEELRSVEVLASELALSAVTTDIRDIDVVYVLCGQRDHDAVVAEAARICTFTFRPPRVVIMGSPATASFSSSLLSEPEAVLHSLARLPRLGLNLNSVELDARANMFPDCAFLSIGHLSKARAHFGKPLRVGVVASRLQMRRAMSIFDAAYADFGHLVSGLSPFPADGVRTMPIGVPDAASEWVATIMLEVRKLMYTRLSGYG